MLDPKLRHTFVSVNSTLVHVAQYGGNANVLQQSSKFNSSSCSFNTTKTASLANLTNNNASQSSTFSINLSRNDSIPSQQRQSQLCQRNKVVIFNPGNPGSLGFYHDFLVNLYRVLRGSAHGASPMTPVNPLIILALGHNDFDRPETTHYKADARICIEEEDLNFVEKAKAKKYINDPYHIELQILNKSIILRRLDLDDCDLIFVSHSIGSYITLRLLQEPSLGKLLVACMLIHPALENLACTESGLLYSTAFTYKLDILLRAVIFLLDKFTTQSFKERVANWKLGDEFCNNSSDIVRKSLIDLIKETNFNSLIQMAKSEFANVKNLNLETMIKPHMTKMRILYANHDHWVNPSFPSFLKDKLPELHVEERDAPHAFVCCHKTMIDYSVRVGNLIRQILQV